MPLLNFLRPPKNQRYAYKPRYWDPDKEKMQERLKHIESLKDSSPEAVKKRLSKGFKGGYNVDKQYRSSAVSKSNIRLLGIIVVLIFLTYLFLTVYLPEIVAAIE